MLVVGRVMRVKRAAGLRVVAVAHGGKLPERLHAEIALDKAQRINDLINGLCLHLSGNVLHPDELAAAKQYVIW